MQNTYRKAYGLDEMSGGSHNRKPVITNLFNKLSNGPPSDFCVTTIIGPLTELCQIRSDKLVSLRCTYFDLTFISVLFCNRRIIHLEMLIIMKAALR